MTNYALAYAKAKKRPSRIDQDGRYPRTPSPTIPPDVDALIGWPAELGKWWERGAEPPTPEELSWFLRWVPEAASRVSDIQDGGTRRWAEEELKQRGKAFDRLAPELRQRAMNEHNGGEE